MSAAAMIMAIGTPSEFRDDGFGICGGTSDSGADELFLLVLSYKRNLYVNNVQRVYHSGFSLMIYCPRWIYFQALY